MSDKLIDVRTPLALSEGVRVELGQRGDLHVVMSALTLHLPRGDCERLTNTLARALVRLRKLEARAARPQLRVVREAARTPDSAASD